MNKFIKEQLDRIRGVDLPPWDENTKHMVIPQKGRAKDHLILYRTYIIELENFILYPPKEFTLAYTWNKGVVPKSKHMQATLTEVKGKMYRFDAIGYDLENYKPKGDHYFHLWLPQKGFKVIEQLT